MGKLLSVLSKDNPPSVDLFVDFEGSQPGESEASVYSLVQADLEKAEQIIKELQQYVGASNEIREAISNPKSEEHQEKAWNALCPLVLKLKHYYEFSINLENIVPQLLQVLCSNDMTPREHLETQQALFKQFAEILDFVLTFDDLKMTNPAIQNDFSYYRRTLSRKKMANEDMKEAEFDVSNEVANRMSLFYAEATPMLKTLSKATTKFVTENKDLPIQYTTDILGTMASVCREMIQNEKLRKKMEKEETEMFCLRVMVGVIILYDHVHHTGAFNKASVIDMKSSVKVLKDYPNARVEGLLNALRYNTIHLNDETTPKNIKALLS